MWGVDGRQHKIAAAGAAAAAESEYRRNAGARSPTVRTTSLLRRFRPSIRGIRPTNRLGPKQARDRRTPKHGRKLSRMRNGAPTRRQALSDSRRHRPLGLIHRAPWLAGPGLCDDDVEACGGPSGALWQVEDGKPEAAEATTRTHRDGPNRASGHVIPSTFRRVLPTWSERGTPALFSCNGASDESKALSA